MAFERSWQQVPAQLLITDGTANGIAVIADVRDYYVKQLVLLRATGQLDLPLEVKRIDGITVLHLGPVNTSDMSLRMDISAYTTALSATIFASEQLIKPIKPDEITNYLYEREPIKGWRSVLVDRYGRKFDSVVDNSGKVRLAVDGQFHAEVDVQVDVDVDGYYDATTNPDPDNIGLIGHTRSTATDQTKQIQRITAKRGTANTDTVAQDISLHDYNGNAYTKESPVPTTGSFEKFFSFINTSKWMELAVYDEVIPAYSVDGKTLTLTYKEDGILLGEAVLYYNTDIDYSLNLYRYLMDDDGSKLLDDDGDALNLD